VRVPALVLAGERDLLVSRASLETLAQGIPDARLVTLPDCGHLAFVTRPELLAEEVRKARSDW
jgi:3-oxoadipate enol-lactonase